MITLSPLAIRIPRMRDVDDRPQVKAWGVCVHTTGVGLPRKAKARGISPMEMAISVYTRMTAFPHYVIDNEGQIVQIADEKERARHAGLPARERQLYLSGRWKRKVSKAALKRWQQRWPLTKSPSHLYPSRGPNTDYLGVECIPLLKPRKDGAYFTRIQYMALGELLTDIEGRHGIKLMGSRLVGHEDVEPLTRWNRYGGWDPGFLRQKPRFDWRRIPRGLLYGPPGVC